MSHHSAAKAENLETSAALMVEEARARDLNLETLEASIRADMGRCERQTDARDEGKNVRTFSV